MNQNIKLTDFGIYVIKDDTHLSRWVEEERRLDHARHFLEQFRKLIPLGGTVIDCGTSIGDHTVTYSSWVGPNGKVIGFEANPIVAECCQLNLQIYPWTTVYNVGLGKEHSTARISMDKNIGASHLSQEGNFPVDIDPLDAYIELVDRCDFMKVDIEGYELNMIKGGVEFLKRYKPAILMEINRGALKRQDATQDQVYNELKRIGYKIKVVEGREFSDQYEILAIANK